MVKRFQPELWEVDFNFSAMASVVCPTQNSLKVTGHFRSFGDYIGLIWNSEDWRMHEDAKYPTNRDYSGTIFSFSPTYEGQYICRFDDINQLPSMTIYYTDNSQKHITMGFYSLTSSYSESISGWTTQTSLSKKFIKWDSEVVRWELDGLSGVGVRDVDYALDYVNGTIAPVAGGSIPYGANLSISYEYGLQNTYRFDFDNLWEGTHPNNASKASSSNIDRVVIPLIPTFCTQQYFINTGRSDEFSVTLNDISIINGDLGSFPPPSDPNPFSVAEGYDDEYYRNPKRLIQSTVHLGYRKSLNIYVGASHYYDKKGSYGTDATDHKTQYLIDSVGVNTATKEWFRYLCKAAKEYDYEDIIISMSLENLQMPESWKQRLWDGSPGQTGWSPPTSFFSPTNPEVRTYWERVVRDFLDIVESEGFTPILQLGEPWWWWQEFMPEDINTPYPGKPPCFYDSYTVNLYQSEKGKPLPVFKTTDIEINPENLEALEWLRDKLGDFSNFARNIAKSYNNGKFYVLFFPPYVLDTQRVKEAMRIVNVPMSAWQFPMLDILQVEDYDWTVHDNQNHFEVYDFGLRFFKYQYHRMHYFAGFAWDQFGIPISIQWERIEKAAISALSYGYENVFIWAGTQIRRDSYRPPDPIKYLPINRNINRVRAKEIEIEN